jgi:hypothetical protein
LACFHLTVSMTGLQDSCQVYQHQRTSSGSTDHQFDFTTCGHPFNSFTPSKTDYVKRIDFIFYRLISNQSPLCYDPSQALPHNPCLIDRIECSTKCATSGLSFSDHQPVAIKLEIRHLIERDTNSVLTRKAADCSSQADVESQSSTSLSESSSNSSKSVSRCSSIGNDDVLQIELGNPELAQQTESNLKSRKPIESVNYYVDRSNLDRRLIQETSLSMATDNTRYINLLIVVFCFST